MKWHVFTSKSIGLILLLSIFQNDSSACTIVSQDHPELKIRHVKIQHSETGVVSDGEKKIGSLGQWGCSTGGNCSYSGGSAGQTSIIGLKNGMPTAGTGIKPTVYLFPDLSLGNKWNSRMRAASRGLWIRGDDCTDRWYDFP